MAKPKISLNYPSPRWSMEIPDCSMPMAFDTYSKCSYNCLYCFAYFQKTHTCEGYTSGHIRAVNPKRVKNIFDSAFRNKQGTVSKVDYAFFPYIQNKRMMQWGGLADEFDEWERRYGITLELLRYFDKIDYPLSFSTKAVWWTKDERYMELFKRHAHNWHVKISIITADEEKARKIELGVPSPAERLEAIKRLSDIGIHVTLRLRPFILGVSTDYKKLIKLAKDAGADSVTTEFFCMETRATPDLLERYKKISEVCGFDIYEFYTKNSHQQGYKRLNRGIKAPIFHEMKEVAESLGMRFYVSDAFCRECNEHCNCCGVPPEWDVSVKGHIGQAIIEAKKNGEVRFSDIAPDITKYYSFQWRGSAGYNTGSNRVRAMNYDTTMAQWLRANWNTPKKGTSPAKGYGGILRPIRIDEDGDVVYRYALKSGEDNGTMQEERKAVGEAT